LAGCTPHSQTAELEIPGAIERVVVELESGDVRIVGSDRQGARVGSRLRWRGSRAPELVSRLDAGTLSLGMECGALSECSIDVDVALPRAVAVDVHGTTGDVELVEIDGTAAVEQTTGTIALTGLRGDLDLETTTGDIEGAALQGAKVRAETTTGGVVLGFSAGAQDVDVEVTTGRVQIHVPAGSYAVDADATTGRVDVGFASDPAAPAKIRARTTTGSVVIRSAEG
jgi:DUF4097 and DUF4098 domain-containing protein YvlB